jgi:TolB-like protein
MFSDIVGYTSLMGKDERKAFDYIRKNRRIHWRLIKKYKGRLLKEMGDGMLASFSSSMDAIKCALSIQNAVKELGIPLRIGIHQGDVIFENKDVLGDGVNIASRIQGIADTHGIVISESVFRDLKNKDGLIITPMGEQELKGVESPIGAFKISSTDANFLEYKIDTGELIRPLGYGRTPIVIGILIIALLSYLAIYFLPRIIIPQPELEKSILVLPFDNYIGSDTMEYFVAGMHSALIGDIGKISSLQVKSKTTANAYKDIEKSIPEIAAELGVNIIIEGSVVCLGDSVCLQIKVVSAYPEEQTLWVQDYYEDKSQILQLYNTITKEISEEINVILTPEEENMLADSRAVDNKAYDAYLKGMYYWEQLTPEGLEKSLEYFNLAMEIDPSWAIPYAAIAQWWLGAKQFSIVPPSVANPPIYENITQALEIDPQDDFVQYVNALITVWTDWDWEKGEKEFLKLLKSNPNDAFARAYYGHLLMCIRRSDEALEQGKMAMELDPLNPLIQALYSVILLDRGEYDEVISITKGINHPLTLYALDLAYSAQGDYEKSFEALIQNLEFSYADSIIFSAQKVYENQGYKAAIKYIAEVYEERFRTSYVMPTDMAWIYRPELNEPEKTLEWLEIGFEMNDPGMPYISTNVYLFDFIRDDPRFLELLKKMNLPIH